MRSQRLITFAFAMASSWASGCSSENGTATGTPEGSTANDGSGGGDGPLEQDAAQGPPSTSDARMDVAPEVGDESAADARADSQPDDAATDAPADQTMETEAGEAPSDGAAAVETGPVCSPPCDHGSCLPSGGCSCDPDWSGPLCDMASPVLMPGVSVAGSVTRGNWALFSYYGQASGLSVTLTEDATVGLVWTYLGAGMAPTQTSNLASDENAQSASHTVAYSFASSGMQTWYVAAYGQPAISTDTQVVPFHVSMTVVP